MQEDSLARALLIVAHIVAGGGDKSDESHERTERARCHPRRQKGIVPPCVERRAAGHHDHRHREIFNRPAAEDPKQEHGEHSPRAAQTMPLAQLPQADVVRQETEQPEHGRPEVDRRAAFPYRHLGEMRDAEPCEHKGGSKKPRRLPKGRAAPRVHREEHDEQQEYERVCSIERHLAGEQQRVEEKEGHHASAVLVVVMQERVNHIGERRDMYPRVPDHRVIIIIAMQRHKVIKRIHQQEDARCRDYRLQDLSFCHELLPPNA